MNDTGDVSRPASVGPLWLCHASARNRRVSSASAAGVASFQVRYRLRSLSTTDRLPTSHHCVATCTNRSVDRLPASSRSVSASRPASVSRLPAPAAASSESSGPAPVSR